MNSIARFKQASSVRSWLISIARYKLIDFLRSESRRQTINTGIEVSLHNTMIERLEEQGDYDSDVLAVLRSCINRLKPDAKQLVDDYYFGNVAATDIAARSNQKSSTIRMMLLRIRRALAKCIRSHAGGGFEL